MVVKAITTLELRRNIPDVREGLRKGTNYLLMYRGKPVAELSPPSKSTKAMFFEISDAKRIKKNVAKRKKERLKKK